MYAGVQAHEMQAFLTVAKYRDSGNGNRLCAAILSSGRPARMKDAQLDGSNQRGPQQIAKGFGDVV